MSGLGKKPNFEPDEHYKKLIGSMFEPSEPKQQEEEPKPFPTRKLKLPEPPAHTKQEELQAMEYARDEMEQIREAFYNFTNEIGNTIAYGYLYNEVEKFIEACQDLHALVEEDVSEDKITENGLETYQKMKKIRARLLHDIYTNYKKDK